MQAVYVKQDFAGSPLARNLGNARYQHRPGQCDSQHVQPLELQVLYHSRWLNCKQPACIVILRTVGLISDSTTCCSCWFATWVNVYMIRSHSVQMKLALPARASKPITPVSHPARKRKIGVRLSHYSALYDLQNELTRKSFAPAEPAHFGHIVHGEVAWTLR